MNRTIAPGRAGFFPSLLARLREVLAEAGRDAETSGRLEHSNLQTACCRLLADVARLEDKLAEHKRDIIRQAMRDLFELEEAELASLVDAAGDRRNRLTSYYKPVKLINKRFDAPTKVRFIEWLWRVSLADGTIGMYEDHLVRKLADLMYVPHADFILAKHRAREWDGSSPD